MTDPMLYATPEELAAVRQMAKALGKSWEVEVSQGLRGEQMFRTRYERVRELLQKARAALAIPGKV